jgi:hypothetical protein
MGSFCRVRHLNLKRKVLTMSRTVFFGLLTGVLGIPSAISLITGADMPFSVSAIYFVVPQLVTLSLTGLFWSIDRD